MHAPWQPVVAWRRIPLCLATLAALACVAPTLACSRKGSHVEEVVRVPYTALVLPKLDGWQVADDVRPGKDDTGGLMLRLVQRSAVVGSPRVEVILEPKQNPPSTLEAFTDRNLREMGQLEQAGSIHILHVQQQPTQVGLVPAWRVQHEFTLGQGHNQVSLYQVSTFCVFNGRGITVTASGRTELFHPLAGSIARLLEGMAFAQGGKGQGAAGFAGQDGQEAGGGHDGHAIDLGKVGGEGR